MYVPLMFRLRAPHAGGFVEAQLWSIRYHASATAWNLNSLAGGILLVFFGGSYDQRLVWAGILLVAAGICAFLRLERVAKCFDLLAVEMRPPFIGAGLGVRLPKARWLTLEHDCIRVTYDDEPRRGNAPPPPVGPVAEAPPPARGAAAG